jgi:hypothetical protein
MRTPSLKSLLLWTVTGAILFGPLAVEAFPHFPAALVQGAMFIFAIYALSRNSREAWAKRLGDLRYRRDDTHWNLLALR